MEKKRVAVLFGGCSPEYKVSLASAASVINNLDKERYDAVLIGISKDGEWFRYFGSTDSIENDTWLQNGKCNKAFISPSRDSHGLLEWNEDKVDTTRIDIAFPVLHGKNGEDGSVQGLLQLAGIPCVGCGILSSSLCMDKDIAHTIARGAGVKTPLSVTIYDGMEASKIADTLGHLRYPLFVKPAGAGSSLGITEIYSPGELKGAIAAAFEYDSKVVIEEYVEGFEVGCAVIGNDSLFIGEVDEIELRGGFLDYNEKYLDRSATIHLPARVPRETVQKIKDTASILYKAMGCTGFARVDMFLTPGGEIVFNEINTIPGFTIHSRYPGMLEKAGLSYGEILDRLIDLAEQSC
jgi:D-alanine---D-serine ligase